MPSYDGRVSGRAVCPLCREVASSEAEMFARSRVGALPSSESEMRGAVEGSRREPLSEAETTPWPERSVDGSPHVSGPRVELP